MEGNLNTSIVILAYNKLEFTKKCIMSIRKYTEKGTYEIIVVDNNLTDITREWLYSQSDLKVILNDKNEIFPGGYNKGIENCLPNTDILLLNNDVIVTKDWLTNLRNCLYSHCAIGAVGPVTNSCEYHQRIETKYQSLEEMHVFADNFNVSDNSKWEEREKLSCFCYLIKGEALNPPVSSSGYWDDNYFVQLVRNGYKLVLCKDTFIHNFGSVSFFENERFEQIKDLVQNKDREQMAVTFYHLIQMIKEDETALEVILNTIEFYSEDAVELLNTLAVLCYQENLMVSYKVFHKALEINPTHQTVLLNYTEFLYNLGEVDQAYIYIKMVHELDEDAKTLYRRIEEEYYGYQKLKFLLRRIECNVESEEATKEFLLLLKNQIINVPMILRTIKRDVLNKVYVLNYISIKNFEHELYDFTLPFLLEANKIAPQDLDTSYNLILCLIQFGKNDLALRYLNQLENPPEKFKELEQALLYGCK